jgi:hypothetical protein
VEIFVDFSETFVGNVGVDFLQKFSQFINGEFRLRKYGHEGFWGEVSRMLRNDNMKMAFCCVPQVYMASCLMVNIKTLGEKGFQKFCG